jgi:hypothetical protein
MQYSLGGSERRRFNISNPNTSQKFSNQLCHQVASDKCSCLASTGRPPKLEDYKQVLLLSIHYNGLCLLRIRYVHCPAYVPQHFLALYVPGQGNVYTYIAHNFTRGSRLHFWSCMATKKTEHGSVITPGSCRGLTWPVCLNISLSGYFIIFCPIG